MKDVLILSGGLDSTVLLWRLLNQSSGRVWALSFNYGQRHVRELERANAVTLLAAMKFPDRLMAHRVIDCRSLVSVFEGSSQTSDIPVPDGHYTDESMKKTVVPNRNMVMLSIAGAYAMSIKADTLHFGAHGGDHAIYPDCRPPFVSALGLAFSLADWHHLSLSAPFLSMTKADIVREGARLRAPMHLTWSCYKGQKKHCGTCGTCVERREAFQLAGVPDFTEFE